MNVWIKLLIFFLLWLFFGTLFSILVLLPYSDSSSVLKDDIVSIYATNHLLMLLTQLASMIGTFISIFIVSRVLEKEKNFYSKFKLQLKGLMFGILIGAILIFSSVFVLILFTGFKITYQGFSKDILYCIGIFIFVAISEESMERGFLLHNLYQKINKYLAILISSLIFALLHVFNSSFNLIGMINIMLAGIIFSLLYLKEMNLSIPIGLHFIWNFLQGPVFGFQVSGLKTSSIFKIQNVSSPDYLINDFGLEGSLVVTVIFTIVIAFFYLNYYRQQKPADSPVKVPVKN